jgi:hypothetical protein
MSHRSRLLLASFAAAALLALAAGTASARRFELTNQRFRVVWASFEFIVSEIMATIRCPLTMEGSFHSKTFSKVSGQLVGYVTSAKVADPCEGGRVSTLPETLPWHIRYASFRGTLPRITEVTLQLIGASWFMDIQPFGIRCLFRTTADHPINLIGSIEAGNVRRFRIDETIALPVGLFPCEFLEPVKFAGTAEAFQQGSTSTRIGIRLVP